MQALKAGQKANYQQHSEGVEEKAEVGRKLLRTSSSITDGEEKIMVGPVAMLIVCSVSEYPSAHPSCSCQVWCRKYLILQRRTSLVPNSHLEMLHQTTT